MTLQMMDHIESWIPTLLMVGGILINVGMTWQTVNRHTDELKEQERMDAELARRISDGWEATREHCDAGITALREHCDRKCSEKWHEINDINKKLAEMKGRQGWG